MDRIIIKWAFGCANLCLYISCFNKYLSISCFYELFTSEIIFHVKIFRLHNGYHEICQ